MNSKRKNIVGISLFLIIFIALLLVATFYDLDISKKLCDLKFGQYFSENTFGLVMETVGECPIYIMLAVAFAILYYNCNRINSGFLKNLLKIVLFIAGIVAFYVCMNTIIGYLGEHAGVEEHMEKLYATIVKALVALVLNILMILAFKNVDEEVLIPLLKFAFVVILTAALANLITQIVKGPVGRMRFRLMKLIGDEDYSGFTKWFVINGKRTVSDEYLALGAATDGYKSFPSGHTCAAGTVYSLICLPDLVAKCKFKTTKALCWILPVIYTGAVAISRIMVGAHYMSDVLIGGTLSFLSAVLFRKLIVVGFKKTRE